jgi:hypothetical protein
VKTSWTSELAGLGNQHHDHTWLPLAMRQHLAEEATLPASSWVWLTACQDVDRCQQMQAHVMFDRTSPPTPGELPRRLLASCLIINGIAPLVYSFDSATVFPPPLPAPHGLLLWPRPSLVEFPPPAVAHRDLVRAISQYAPWLLLHDRPFDPTATGGPLASPTATRPTLNGRLPFPVPARGAAPVPAPLSDRSKVHAQGSSV